VTQYGPGVIASRLQLIAERGDTWLAGFGVASFAAMLRKLR